MLEGALLFTIVAHAVAMVSMAALLLPGMPGGVHAEVADRTAYVAGHPWLWRLGWLPWQITAASDLLLGVALVRTSWIRRGPAVLALVFTALAIIPDQVAQWRWAWGAAGEPGEYLRFEDGVFALTAGWGAMGYLLGAIGWTWCFAGAGIWSRGLARLSWITWGLFAVTTVMVFLPEDARRLPAVGMAMSGGTAAAFVLLMVWLAWITEEVLRHSRPEEAHGGRARWRHPARGVLARACEVVASSRLVRAVGRCLPSAGMSSDIRDVVYVNYLVEAAILERFAIVPLELQRLGPEGRYAMFTFLTYRHGHFGPTRWGSLRRVWPSPVQSNWRIYVHHPRTGRRGVQFLRTAITSTPHALATRILAEGVPMHVPASAGVERGADGTIRVRIDPGAGSSPDVEAVLAPASEPSGASWGSPWSECFASWREMLAYCVPQDRALSAMPWSGEVMRQEIQMEIPLEGCRALAGRVRSSAASAIVGEAAPVCFVVDQVGFRFSGEEIDR